MDLLLLAVVALGALFFIIGYLAFVAAGFKHHFITGVIAAIPVVNIITVPVLWYLTGKKLILSAVGILLIVGAWFLGADKGIDQLSRMINGQTISAQSDILTPKNNTINSNQTSFSIPSTNNSPPTSAVKNIATPYKNLQRDINNKHLKSLPIQPLYKMLFETVPAEKYNETVGLFVRIQTLNNDQFAGNVSKFANNTIHLSTAESTAGSKLELPVATIKNLQLMVKKTN